MAATATPALEWVWMTHDIVAAAMDRAVNDEPGLVHGGIGLIDQVAVEIDLDEVGGGHLVKEQPEAVEQKVAGLVRHARRNVRVDQIGPAEMLDQTVTCRELDALFPLGGSDVGFGGSADRSGRWHSRLLLDLLRGDHPRRRMISRSVTPGYFNRCAASRTMLRSVYFCTSMGPLRNPRSRCTSILDCSAARSGRRSGLREYSLLVNSQPANSSGRSLVILAAICTASS